jgi:hypothetical protein
VHNPGPSTLFGHHYFTYSTDVHLLFPTTIIVITPLLLWEEGCHWSSNTPIKLRTSHWYVVPTGGSQEIRENYSVENSLKKTYFMFTCMLHDAFQQLYNCTEEQNNVLRSSKQYRQTDRLFI